MRRLQQPPRRVRASLLVRSIAQIERGLASARRSESVSLRTTIRLLDFLRTVNCGVTRVSADEQPRVRADLLARVESVYTELRTELERAAQRIDLLEQGARDAAPRPTPAPPRPPGVVVTTARARCRICLEHDDDTSGRTVRMVVLRPCCHVCCCETCCASLDACPVCRARIEDWHRVYVA